MNTDKIIAGVFSLFVSGWFTKNKNVILQYISDLHKRHHEEEVSQDLIYIVKIFVTAFSLSALVVSIILLFQGISSEY
jgi:Ca2+/Na+ antiporter